MTDEHKAAIAEGREQNRIVRSYLEAVDENKPKRGRKRNPENIAQRLATIEATLPSADPMTRLHLIQERSDLKAELDASGKSVDLTAVENDFVAVAKSYGQRKGIDYATWRELGVPRAVLQRAGITRTG